MVLTYNSLSNASYNGLLIASYGAIGNALYLEFKYGTFSKDPKKKYNLKNHYHLFNYGTMLGATIGIFHTLYMKSPQDYF